MRLNPSAFGGAFFLSQMDLWHQLEGVMDLVLIENRGGGIIQKVSKNYDTKRFSAVKVLPLRYSLNSGY